MSKEKEKDEKPAEQPAEKPDKKAAAKKGRPLSDMHPINWIVLFILAVGVGYTGYATHGALTSSSGVVATATPTPKDPSIPELKLHQNHQRNAPEVEVNQNEIGRSNPLQQP